MSIFSENIFSLNLFNPHAAVGRHFSGAGSPAGDRWMFRHLRRCERCRTEYRLQSALEALGDGAHGDQGDRGQGDRRARERLGRGIFPASRQRLLMPVGLVVALACVALVITVKRPSDSFQARGSAPGLLAATGPSLGIYRIGPRGESERAGSIIHAGESLAFSFINPASTLTVAGGYRYLMVFAVDPSGRVFWYWPAWTSATSDPASVAIAAGGDAVELGEAVRHSLGTGPLTMVGLFSNQPYHTRQIDAALSRGLDGLRGLDGHVWTETLEVAP